MSTYNIPRDTKGEGRILYIFSTKALIYTFGGVLIGGIFWFILNIVNLSVIGIVIAIIFGIIGFSIATFKVPNIKSIKATKNIGGEKLDEIIKRMIKFKMKKTTKYTLFTKEEEIDGQ